MAYIGKMDDLERFWDPGETPTWLKESLETIAERYQQTRDVLKQIDSHQLAEYHQHMFYHDYGLAIHLNNCYDLGKLDLHSTQIFLNRCLQNYDRIPPDDRDYSVDKLSGMAKEVQENVKEESVKLKAPRNGSSRQEYVETCLALGSIDNTIELQQVLKECSDKKRLTQLLWCAQLVRLVIFLEEEALVKTFQRVEIPMENETCLARAYYLVKNGNPSKNRPKPSNQIYKSGKEHFLYGRAKERVRNIINSEIVQHKKSLEQVKSSIIHAFRQELSVTDTAFIEDEYKVMCLALCLKEITESMHVFLKGCKETDVLNHLNLIERLNSLDDMPDHFKLSHYFKELLKLLPNEREKQSILQHFKKNCIEHIYDFCDAIKGELDLMSCLMNYLRHSRNVKLIAARLGLCEATSKVDLMKIMNLTDRENIEHLAGLKCMISDLLKGNQLIIEDKILETVRSFMEPAQIETVMIDGRAVVEVTGKHIVLSEVLGSVENAMECSYAIKYNIPEVRFIGGEVFHVDADLVNDKWHGVNIAVRSKLIMVHGTVVWDVSGKNCKRKHSPAYSASILGGDGGAGQDGFPGESGGNVLILAEQTANCEQFTIMSNGGDGGDGQDGGNGQKGQDGCGIERKELEKKFKSPVRFLALASTRAKEVERIVNSIMKNFPTISNLDISGSEIFIEGSGLDGQRITFSYCEPKLFQSKSHCYLVHKGSLGKPGGTGGDFGRGGQGGFPGNITVKNIATFEVINVQKSTDRGQDGQSGAAGFYGNTGMNGWDMGFLDSQFWKDPVYFGEDYASKLTVTYHDVRTSDMVWCWHKNKYATIARARPENNFVTSHRRRHFKQRDRKQSAAAVMKKTLIESSFIAKYEQHFNSVENNVLFNIYNRMQSILQRDLDGSTEQQKKTSKRQKVQHMICYSNQNIDQDLEEPLSKIPKITKPCTQKSTLLLNSVFRKDSMISWRQLKNCRIEKSDLNNKFTLLDSLKKEKTKLSNKDLHSIQQNLIDKYRLLAFEELSVKIDTDAICTNKFELVSRYASICLEEDPRKSSNAWHEDLETLDEYIFQFTNEKQQFQLASYCERIRRFFPSSVVQAFFEETEAVNLAILTYINQHKFSSELQNYDSTVLMEQFLQELVQSSYKWVLKIWYHSEEQSSLAAKLIHEIDRDYRLGKLRARYMQSLNQTFNTDQCLQDDNFFNSLRTTIIKKGPVAKSYRELLACAFGVNIQIYSRNSCGQLILQDNHNPEAIEETVYFLLHNDSFLKLSLNENLMKLEDARRTRAMKYSVIMDHLTSLNEKRLIEDYMSDDFLLRCNYTLSNDVERSFCNANLVKEILNHFSFGERHTVERLFTQSDVSKSVYSKLLRNMLLRFDTEGKHVSTDEIHFLVIHYLAACTKRNYEETIISWIVLAYPQQYWVREILLLNLEQYFEELLVKKSEWRSYLTKVENKSILLLLSSKLAQKKPESSLTIDKIDKTLQLLFLSTIKPETLQKLPLPEWNYVLEEIFWTDKLKQITRWQPGGHKFKKASYYTVSLLNQYSSEMIEKLFDKFGQQCATENDIVTTLWSVYNGRCVLTEENISLLDQIGLQEWMKQMKSQARDYKERGIATLVKLILENKNASEIILEKLPIIKKDIQNINKERSIVNNLMKKDQTDPNNVKGKSFKRHILKTESFMNTSTPHKLKDIDDAIYENFNFRLRNSQKLTVLTLLGNYGNNLAQVATGEGKSLIVVAVAIIKASQGQKVDIITSSTVLAKRDAEQNKSIYAKFGINVSHNCSEDIEKRKEAYSGNQIVYGDLSSFQRDYLLHKFYQKNVIGDRNFENVIVDEVDSMLLDRGNNILYLSHDLPDMDKLESVYVYIWQWVNNSSNGFDPAVIKDAVLWQIYGVLKATDIGKLDVALSEDQQNLIWNKLVAAKIIDGEGKLMVESINRGDLGDVLGSEFLIYLDRLEYLLKECINREKCIHVPNYMRSFVDLHLESWIEAAKNALVMEVGHDYVVDVDRSGSSADRTPNVTILDRDTGTDMVNSQWESALHQFVQLKHGCKTYLQSLKAVFISNVTFFKLYDKLYGLSGTLGSRKERDLLGEVYGVNFVNIPTAKCKLFDEDAPIVCKNASDWKNAIVNSATFMTQKRQRSVLIICETLNDVTELHKAFRGKTSTDVRTYTREYEDFDLGELPPGQIIIATNLAGRGTDIKITPELKHAGGVHVCLTYLPSNIRVEQQVFGRAARCGDRGSGQLVVLDQTESLSIMKLKRKRDTRELSRISLIKAYYETRIVKEESCFKKFTQQYDKLRKLLSTSSVTKDKEELIEILLSSCLDRWVYWLDKNGKNLVDKSKQHAQVLDRSLDKFLAKLKILNAEDYQSLLEWVDTSIPRMIRLARYFIMNKQNMLAHKLLDNIITMEPAFSEAALYYKACALSTEINMSDVNTPEIKTFSRMFRSAAHLFDQRCVNLMANVSVIESVKTNFKNNILPITAYREQKQTMCKFYGALTHSIDAVLGHPVTGWSFVDEHIKTGMSFKIFNALLERNIVQYPTIRDDITEKELKTICYAYGTSAAKLLNFFKNRQEKQGKSIEMEQFLSFFKLEMKLPSREGFWKFLLEKHVLRNDEKYIVVNKHLLSYEDMKFLEEKVSQARLRVQKVTTDEKELLLYPDQLLDENVYTKSPLKTALGLAKYAAFKEIGAISFQRKARLNLDESKIESIRFLHYDSISLEDFSKLNISQNDANHILDLLVKFLVLKRQDCNKEVYVLRCDYSIIKNIQLGPYKIYEEAVKDLLNLCFCYRIAFQRVLSSVKEKKILDITLMSKPHRRVVADLLVSGIIEPAKVSAEINQGLIFNALHSLKLDMKWYVNVVQRLDSLKGSLCKLKLAPFPEQDRFTNIEEWCQFSMNGLDLLMQKNDGSLFGIALTFLWGAFQIVSVWMQNPSLLKPKHLAQELRKFTTGWKNICSACRMACNLYATDYYKLKYNNFLKQVAFMGVHYFGVGHEQFMRFAFEVSEPSARDIKHVKQLSAPLIRGFDIVSENSGVILLIEDRLKITCKKLSDEILTLAENNETFSIFGKKLNEFTCLMGIEQAKSNLASLTETHFKRQSYFSTFEMILEKISENILQVISKETQRHNEHKSVVSILSDEVYDVAKTTVLSHGQNLSMNVSKILEELSARLHVQSIGYDNPLDNLQQADSCTAFVVGATNNVKNILRVKLEALVQQFICKPVLEKGTFMLMNYAERCVELGLDTEEGGKASEHFAKKVLIEKLKKEAKNRRKDLAMTPVENLLDQQFNEALAKWERSASELERLAVWIRKGDPIDGQYLELCLDAVRFVLLRHAVVISNVCVNLVTDNETKKTCSSPRKFNGIATDLHLINEKFQVGLTHKTTGKSTANSNCLYDCLLKNIFELRTISSQQFALEISQHLVNISDNKTNTNSSLKTVLDFSKPTTIRELSFAQFLQTCFECPSRGVIAYSDLMERAKNRINCARDWHGRGADRVEVVSCYGLEQFVKAGSKSSVTTETSSGSAMSDLRNAFLTIYQQNLNQERIKAPV